MGWGNVRVCTYSPLVFVDSLTNTKPHFLQKTSPLVHTQCYLLHPQSLSKAYLNFSISSLEIGTETPVIGLIPVSGRVTNDDPPDDKALLEYRLV